VKIIFQQGMKVFGSLTELIDKTSTKEHGWICFYKQIYRDTLISLTWSAFLSNDLNLLLNYRKAHGMSIANSSEKISIWD
jgi:hypothetical protein